MVCIPCIVIPIFLYIWHRFIQPIVTRFWNAWGHGEKAKTIQDIPSPQPDQKISCPFSSSRNPQQDLDSDSSQQQAFSKKVL